MRYYITIILTILTLVATAQKKEKLSDKLKKGFESVDWDLVNSVVNDPSSEFYYPTIYAKYITGDTTLTLVDYRMLYYGYSYQEPYNPLAEKPLNDIVIQYQTEVFNTNSHEELMLLVEKTKKALVNDPFNLKMLNILTYAYSRMKDEYNVIINSRRMNGVIEAILSSGSGVDRDSAWSVIYRDDIVDLSSVLGGLLKGRMYITTNVEYFHLNDKIEDVKGFYFDLSPILRMAKVTETGFRGFEFDPGYRKTM